MSLFSPAVESLCARRFFCTAGRGMERFVLGELLHKVSALDVETMSGKVFFTAKPDLCTLTKVKSAERIFLLLQKGPPLSLTAYKGDALSILQKCIIGEPHLWLEALLLWQKLQKQLAQVHLPGQGVGLKRKLEVEPAELKSKTCKQETTAKEAHVKCQDQAHTETMAHLVAQKLHGEDTDKTTPQLFPNESSAAITFRVSCRCSGANTKMTTAQEVGRIIGVSLSKLFGWKADLRRPMLEVFVHLNDMYSVVGFPVIRQPLASRDYIQTTGLRSTTAWAMASLAEISTATCVLDPMCGVGTILLEAAKEWPIAHGRRDDVKYFLGSPTVELTKSIISLELEAINLFFQLRQKHASFLGIDISDSQLKSAVGNVKKAGVTDYVSLLKGSVLGLPIHSESMDVVISDIPFGKKFTCSKDMKELLPDILREMERVLRIGGVLVLLLSQKLHYHLKTHFHFKSAESTSMPNHGKDSLLLCKDESAKTGEDIVMKKYYFPSLAHIESHSVSLGVTEAVIFKCKKTSKSIAL